MNCGAVIAPLGYRRAGLWTALSETKRSVIYVCRRVECKARAEEWKSKADGKQLIKRRKPVHTSPPKANAAQAELF